VRVEAAAGSRGGLRSAPCEAATSLDRHEARKYARSPRSPRSSAELVSAKPVTSGTIGPRVPPRHRRRRLGSSTNVAIKNFANFLVAATLFWLFGYALMFASGGGGVVAVVS
jgi:hypothetical protein